MKSRVSPVATPLATAAAVVAASALAAAMIPNLFPFQDPTGRVATFNVAGALDPTNPFFQSLGTNGRTCASCHVAGAGFGLAPADVQARFVATNGTDPLFAAIDGANCPAPGAPADATAHSLLLTHGLIRVALPVPPVTTAAGTLTSIVAEADPYGCAVDPTGEISVYRRPLPTTNLRFLSAVMADGRESVNNPATGQCTLGTPQTFAGCLQADLAHQALDATLGHAQAATPPTNAQLAAIVELELGFSTAQSEDHAAGRLDTHGATGGPLALSHQPYAPGINDALTPGAFTPAAFTLFTAWEPRKDDLAPGHQGGPAARAAVAVGEQIFNTFPLTITHVRGLNDSLNRPSIPGTCTTCHDTPNVGNHSLPVPLDIGTSHVAAYEPAGSALAAALSQLSLPPLPVYRVNGCTDPFTLEPVYTTDPGKALITGLCSDVTRIKGPVLRGLAARAPYFHNGAAATLEEVVNFYNLRFQMNLTDDQKAALVAFLGSL